MKLPSPAPSSAVLALLLSSASFPSVNAYGVYGGECEGTIYHGTPIIKSGSCSVNTMNGFSCVTQQGGECVVNGIPLSASPVARAVVRTAPSELNSDYAKWLADQGAEPAPSPTPVEVTPKVYQDYMNYYNPGVEAGNVGVEAGNVGEEAGNVGVEAGNVGRNTMNLANTYAGGFYNGGSMSHHANGGAYMYNSASGGNGVENMGYRRLEGAADTAPAVLMDFALIGLQGNCSDGCVANIYDGNECTDEVLAPLSPIESFTYYTNNVQMSAGNSTLPGSVNDYVGKAILFHNSKSGEINVNNGLDACGIFEPDGSAATDRSEDPSPAARILVSTLAVAAVAASVFF